jgi:hypothetical protein
MVLDNPIPEVSVHSVKYYHSHLRLLQVQV